MELLPSLPPPELVSRGRPFVGNEVRKAVYEAKERLRVGKRAVVCLAGDLASVQGPRGMVVRCGVEHSLISEGENPSTLVNRCMSVEGCLECPSWRAEKERIWAARPPLVGAREGDT